LAYSRAGDLQVDANGRLMTPAGHLIEPIITLPNDLETLHVAENGTIYGRRAGAEAETPLGQLQLARFINPGGLRPIGDNLFVVTENSGPAQLGQPGQNGLGELVGGVLEGSNVDLSAEMTQMIQAQRAYQVNLKALQTIDEMTGQALQLRR
jgi:flagellar basal-body rod protein FlgG